MQRKRVADSHGVAKRVKHELHGVMESIQNPKDFKKSFLDLYSKYSLKDHQAKGDAKGGAGGDGGEGEGHEIEEEYLRQKEYLQKSVSALKKKLTKDSAIHRGDNQRAMQENMALIKNINELRKEIQFLKHEQQQSRLNQM